MPRHLWILAPLWAACTAKDPVDVAETSDTSAPDTDTSAPDTDTSAPDTDTGVPDTDTGVPDTDTGVPDTDTGVPDTDPPDADGDGFSALIDCNDADEAVFPGATELCNGVDDNCDEFVDEGLTTLYFTDFDGDAFGDPLTGNPACEAPIGTVDNDLDCNDQDAFVYPGAADLCEDGIDQDCDEQDPICPNQSPTVVAGPLQVITGLETVQLLATASDPDGQIATYVWVQTSGSAVTLADADTPSPTFVAPPEDGLRTFEVEVTDDEGATATAAQTVEVDNQLVLSESQPPLPYTRTDPASYATHADCQGVYYPNPAPPTYLAGGLLPLHTLEAERVSFHWGADYSAYSQEIADFYTDLETDPVLRQEVVDSLNAMMDSFELDYGFDTAPQYSESEGECYKLDIYEGHFHSGIGPSVGAGTVCDNGVTGVPFITAWMGSAQWMWENPGRFPYVYGHELTHTHQCTVPRGDSDGWTWYIESYAVFMGNQMQGSTVGVAPSRSMSHYALDAYILRYPRGVFWQYTALAFGTDYTADVMERTAVPTESLLEYLRRTAPFDCPAQDDDCRADAMGDFFAEYAASTVNYVELTEATGSDYRSAATLPWGYELNNGYQFLSADLVKVGPNRYRPLDAMAPQRFGYNVIRLYRDPGAQYLKLTLDGWDLPGRSSEWRAVLVATTDTSTVPRQEVRAEMFDSGTQIIDLDAWETSLGADIDELHLVVAAVPREWESEAELSSPSSPERYRELDRYVYELGIEGAYPFGFEPADLRDPLPFTGGAHPNGGGFVAYTADVDPGVYVGPLARVLGYTVITDPHVRVEGRAQIGASIGNLADWHYTDGQGNVIGDVFQRQHPTVSGDVILSGKALIRDTATVSEQATLRERAVVGGSAYLRDDAGAYGTSQLTGTIAVDEWAVVYGSTTIETGNSGTLSGTALVDGFAWYGGYALDRGSVYDDWTVDAAGLTLAYDFEVGHRYRIRDTLLSNDAYFLEAGVPASEVPLAFDAELSSSVLEFTGEGHVELPRMLLDRRNYSLVFRLKGEFSGGGAQCVLNATTEVGERFLLEMIPVNTEEFELRLELVDRAGQTAEVTVAAGWLRTGQWVDIAIEHEDDVESLALMVFEHGGAGMISDATALPSPTRRFDYDTLGVQLGGCGDLNSPLNAHVDDFQLWR